VSRAKEVSFTKNEQGREIEAGDAGTEVGRTDDPLTRYRAKEATPDKEHEQTVVEIQVIRKSSQDKLEQNPKRQQKEPEEAE
jgi:hypothetical protein